MIIRRTEVTDGLGFHIKELGPNERVSEQSSIEPGIAPLVEALTNLGFVTYASCEGGLGHSTMHPWVRVRHDYSGREVTALALRDAMLNLGYVNFIVRVEHCVHRPHVFTSWVEVELGEKVKLETKGQP